MTEKIMECFAENFPEEQQIFESFCPYRICPLGAHSDHQKGLVCGFAIDKGITIAYSPTPDGSVEAVSMNFDGKKTFSVRKIPEKQNDWADYIRGAVYSLSLKYTLTCGIKAVIYGSLPIGGLSSSAAVVISFLSAVCSVNSIRLTKKELIETALNAENLYVGVNCGVLDQSCEVLSKKDHLLFLDTKDDSYELIPENPKTKPYEIAIFFSGIERTLAGSPFNKRVDEMRSAAFAVKAFAGMDYDVVKRTYLRDVPREEFDKYKHKLPGPFARRAEHYYSEFERVKNGVEYWRNGDIESFGRLSFESGYSSIYNYETGSPELKALYEIMRRTDGIYGGRFSGAGFKGCCMALIDPSYEEAIKNKVTEEYLKQFPALSGKFEVFFCRTADGCNFSGR